MKFIALSFLLNLSISVFGQVANVKPGLWSDATVWNTNNIPTDTSIIVLQYDIVVNVNAVCFSLATNGFNLTINPGVSLNIVGRNDILYDIDGNLYHKIKIDNQVWMKENLNVSRYRNGDTIPEIKDPLLWRQATIGAWCYYNNDSANSKYGKLYNWYAITDPRNIAPVGWHVPSDDEWKLLPIYLVDEYSTGGKMKDTGFVHWASPNTGATNSSGFTGLGAGIRVNGSFEVMGYWGRWWTSSLFESNQAYSTYRALNFSNPTLNNGYSDKSAGYSVRLVGKYDYPAVILQQAPSTLLLTDTSGVCITNVIDSGSSVLISRGVCWTTSPTLPTMNDQIVFEQDVIGELNTTITGLTPKTRYYLRAFAINNRGIAYSNLIAFTTK